MPTRKRRSPVRFSQGIDSPDLHALLDTHYRNPDSAARLVLSDFIEENNIPHEPGLLEALRLPEGHRAYAIPDDHHAPERLHTFVPNREHDEHNALEESLNRHGWKDTAKAFSGFFYRVQAHDFCCDPPNTKMTQAQLQKLHYKEGLMTAGQTPIDEYFYGTTEGHEEQFRDGSSLLHHPSGSFYALDALHENEEHNDDGEHEDNENDDGGDE